MNTPNTNIGDAGFIFEFGDGTVTTRLESQEDLVDRLIAIPRIRASRVCRSPKTGTRSNSTIALGESQRILREQVGPKQPYFEHDFKGAKFIWTDDIELDNTVLFRHFVKSPPDGKARADYSNLNNVVPESPPKGPGKGPKK